MNQTKLTKWYTILELPENSTWAEVTDSYRSLKKLYSTPSIAIDSINEDMLDERAEDISHKIENAYRELEKHFNSQKLADGTQIEDLAERIDSFAGASLKAIRQGLKVELVDIAVASNIQIKHLKNIERENFQDLPKDVYLRGYLKSYADHLSLNSSRVVDDYMQRFQQWRNASLKGKEKAVRSIRRFLPSWFKKSTKK